MPHGVDPCVLSRPLPIAVDLLGPNNIERTVPGQRRGTSLNALNPAYVWHSSLNKSDAAHRAFTHGIVAFFTHLERRPRRVVLNVSSPGKYLTWVYYNVSTSIQELLSTELLSCHQTSMMLLLPSIQCQETNIR